MARKIYLDFQDSLGFIDISNYVKYDTLQIISRACSDNLHYAQNEAAFVLNYAPDSNLLTESGDYLITEDNNYLVDFGIYTKLSTATQDTPIKILDNYDYAYLLTENNLSLVAEDVSPIVTEAEVNIPMFYGSIPPTKSRTYNGIVNNIQWQIEAIDDTKLLDIAVGDICWRNYKIMDSSNKTVSIIHQLAYLAGLTDDQIDQNVGINITLNAFSPQSPEDLITDVMDTLLFEYGYVLNFDNEGRISPIKWIIDDNTAVFDFTDENIAKSISIKDSIKTYDGTEVIWYELAEATTTSGLTHILLYRDSNLPYAENGGFLGYPVTSGYYYPNEANTIDPTTSGNQIVYQEYDDSALKYWTNAAIKNNLDYNYKAYDSDYSDIVATSGWYLDWRGDARISLVSSDFYNKKARVLFQSTSTSGNNLYFMNIYGKVLYKSGERKSKYGITTNPRRLDKYASIFLFDSTNANKLALYLGALHSMGDVYYEFDSEYDVYVGQVVNVVLDEGESAKGLVMEKRFDEYTQLWSYSVRKFSNTLGALTSQGSGRAPRVLDIRRLQKYLGAFSVLP